MRHYLHPACRPFSCGQCGVEIEESMRIATRDDLDICEDCDDAAATLGLMREAKAAWLATLRDLQ